MKRLIFWLPLLALAGFLSLFTFGLAREQDDFVRSRMVGKPMPALALRPAVPDRPGFTTGELKGKAQLVNIFASWCLPCQAEAPQLNILQRMGVPIVGVAVNDRPEAVTRFLRRHGNPYSRIGADNDGRVQLLLGSSGVPETYVIAADGQIVHQHIGDIRVDDVPKLAAMVRAHSQ